MVKAKGRAVSRRMRTPGAVLESTLETVNEYFDRWLALRERRGLRSARNDKGRFGKWIAPHLGTRPIGDVKKDEIKAVVRALDDAVRARQILEDRDQRVRVHDEALLRRVRGEGI